MATIDDYGGQGETLAAPPLGGPDGWAAAVAAELHRLGDLFRGGFFIGSTDLAGRALIPHGMNRTPVGGLVTVGTNGIVGGFYANLVAMDATHLTVGVFQAGGQPQASATVYLSWIAIGGRP